MIEIHGRKQIEVNTDPQRHCYNGVHFSSEMVWTAWCYLGAVETEKEAKASVASWQQINPKNQYEYRMPK